jgi:hypothetical protein
VLGRQRRADGRVVEPGGPREVGELGAGRRGDQSERAQASVGQALGGGAGQAGQVDHQVVAAIPGEERRLAGGDRDLGQRGPAATEVEDLERDLLADAADRRDAVLGQVEQLDRAQDAGAIERVLGAGAERQRVHRRVGGDRGDRLVGERRRLGRGGRDVDRVDGRRGLRLERALPGPAHGLGVGVAVGHGAGEGGGKERRERRAHAGVDALGEMRTVLAAVASSGLAGR